MRLLVFALLLANACSSNKANGPKAGTILPDVGMEARCADLEPYAAKWTERLRMGDWQMAIGCSEIPDSENAWALSFVDVNRRQIVIAVDPDAPDHELTVLHELTHGVLMQVREAESELVEEQEARTLSELMLCREKVGDQ